MRVKKTRSIRVFVIVGNDEKGIYCLAVKKEANPYRLLELPGGQVNNIWDDAEAEIRVLQRSDIVIHAPSSKIYIGGLISPQYFEKKGLLDLVFMQVISNENTLVCNKNRITKVYLSKINESQFINSVTKNIAEIGMLLYNGDIKKARKILLPGEKLIMDPHFIDKGGFNYVQGLT